MNESKKNHPKIGVAEGTWWLGAGVLLVLIPLFAPAYYIYLSTEILIYGLLALSFNLLFGYTGMLSFGQGAFFGVGAYTAALALKHVYPSMLLAIVLAIASSFLFATVIGFFCIRLTGLYFAMLTLAFGQMIYAVIFKWREVTGGDDGLVGITRVPLDLFGWPIPLGGETQYFYFALILVGLAVWLIKAIINSPFGQVLQGIRENSERVSFLGLNARSYQLMAFTLSASIAGLAGALYAPFKGIVDPGQAHWIKSADAVMMSLVGGTTLFAGPLIGAGLYMFLKEIILSYTEFWMIYFGPLMVLLVIYLPGGCAGYLNRLYRESGFHAQSSAPESTDSGHP